MTYSCCDTFTVWWVKPCNVPLATFSFDFLVTCAWSVDRNKFVVFDIKDFYPTITKDLLTKSLKFAGEKVQISNDDKKIIYYSKKQLFIMKTH